MTQHGEQTPFDRAVARERAAIATHESAAVAEDSTAEFIEQRAQHEPDPGRRDALNKQARGDRERADRARERAGRAKKRLADEGVEI